MRIGKVSLPVISLTGWLRGSEAFLQNRELEPNANQVPSVENFYRRALMTSELRPYPPLGFSVNLSVDQLPLLVITYTSMVERFLQRREILMTQQLVSIRRNHLTLVESVSNYE